jgi:hypothetical protein
MPQPERNVATASGISQPCVVGVAGECKHGSVLALLVVARRFPTMQDDWATETRPVTQHTFLAVYSSESSAPARHSPQASPQGVMALGSGHFGVIAFCERQRSIGDWLPQTPAEDRGLE